MTQRTKAEWAVILTQHTVTDAITGCQYWRPFFHKRLRQRRPMQRWRGKPKSIAVMNWEIEHDARTPPGKGFHHMCVNEMCINANHLLSVTPKEHVEIHNMLRQDPSNSWLDDKVFAWRRTGTWLLSPEGIMYRKEVE